jgi:hypothetical protein
MAWNRQQFVNGVLLDLNVIALGESPAAEDFEAVASRLETLVADLQARGKCYLPDLDEIPDQLVEPLRDLVALRLAPAYGRAPAALPDIILAEDRVKSVSAPPPTRRTLSTDPVLRRGALRIGVYGRQR